MQNILVFTLAFLIVYIVTPILMKLSLKYNFTDKPTKRKKHRGNIPLCGGIAMYMGFFGVYLFIDNGSIKEKIGVLIGGTLILAIGLIDDYYKAHGKEFPIYPRLIIQLLAAFIVFKSGIGFYGFTDPFTGVYKELAPVVQLFLTITWIFGVTTVINWSDGMDGLAGGLSFISALTFAAAAIILKQADSALVSLVVAGVTVGFLIYNRYPARVFMGDSGANLIGFILSIIALDGAFKQATIMSLFIPILALAVPIFDNLFVIAKRFSEGKPVYQADRSQIHFRLQAKGLSQRQVVTYINIISLTFSAISIILLLIRK
ncbi:MAG: MraY family glycosyltransferase [Clostridium sp.]